MHQITADRLATERADFRPAFLPFPLSGFTEKRMTRKTYAEKLKDPRWQKKRLETLSERDWTCEQCGSTTETLNVHHNFYLKDREPWDYETAQLSVLCEQCHELHHKEDYFAEAASRLPVTGKNSRLFYGFVISGALDLEVELDNPWCEEAYRLGRRLNEEFDKAMKPRLSELRRSLGEN